MSRIQRGERGPVGDHGQDGVDGQAGATGRTGATGAMGHTGLTGKDFLTKRKTVALFLFVVLAFTVLAWRSEYNDNKINKNRDVVKEICNSHPEFAPTACERLT